MSVSVTEQSGGTVIPKNLMPTRLIDLPEFKSAMNLAMNSEEERAKRGEILSAISSMHDGLSNNNNYNQQEIESITQDISQAMAKYRSLLDELYADLSKWSDQK